MSDFMNDEMIDLDFTGVTAVTFGPVPDGDYVGRILAEKMATSTTTNGNRALTIWVEIFHAFDPSYEVPEGKRVRHQFVFSEKSKKFNKPFFDAITDASGVVSFSPSMLVDKEVGMTLGHDSYEDKSGNTVRHNVVLGWFKANL